MPRGRFLSNRLCLLSMLLLVGPLFLPSAQAKGPNIILVLTDDQGYGELSSHGNTILNTPQLDRLASGAVRLTDFHVDPTCSPTRSALMTGRYSSRTGVWHTIAGRSLMRPDEVTLAEALKAGGYQTAIFGKWHLGDNLPLRPQDQGFEETFIHGGGGVGQTPDFWGNDYFDDTYIHNGESAPVTGYCTDVWFDRALGYIDQHRDDDRPFFVYLATNAPHGPYRVPPEFAAPFDHASFEGQPVNAPFYGMIANIDANMGRLLDRLEEWNLTRDTILIFATDNGSASPSFNAGMRGQKGSPYDGGHRVPCLIRWPGGGIDGGRDVDRLTAHIDLFPTLLALCGVRQPDGPPIDGLDLSPVLRGEADPLPSDRTLFVHSQRIETPEKWRQSAVMTDQYRLINGRELFDIQADPGQQSDIAADHPLEVANLRAAYEAWWMSMSTQFDKFVRIRIGDDLEAPTSLTCHDWHSESVPWNQTMIPRLPAAQGDWRIEVAQPGSYVFTLRHQPAVDPVALRATEAEVAVTLESTEPNHRIVRRVGVEPGAESVTLRLPLEAGPAILRTSLHAADGTERGAFFVEIHRDDDSR